MGIAPNIVKTDSAVAMPGVKSTIMQTYVGMTDRIKLISEGLPVTNENSASGFWH